MVDEVYVYYLVIGGCTPYGDSIYVSFKRTEAFWSKTIISEGAVIRSESGPDQQGYVTKKFNLKAGAGNMDRVGFYV